MHEQTIEGPPGALAVVFDIGGVLEHTPPTGWQARWAERAGLTRAEFDRRLAPSFEQGAIGAIDLGTVEREVATRLELDDDGLRAFMDEVWTEYLGTLNRELAAYFASLRPRYRTGILSNSFAGAREREQALYGFEDMCDVIVYSHEVGCRKPDPRAYAIVCERLTTRPDQTVFLDDVQANVDGARTAGMTGVLFKTNDQAIAEVNRALAGRQ